VQSIFINRCFQFTKGSVCHVKRFITADEEVETEVRKWLGRQSKGFYAAGYDALVKRWDKLSVLVEDMSRNNSFCSGFEYDMSYVLYIPL
jgi:hypothetical protein